MQQSQKILEAFRKERIPFTRKEPLSQHTSFRIGGPAALFCEPSDREQLRKVIDICRTEGVRYYILGRGTNVLFADEGFSGVVLHIGGAFSRIARSGDLIMAEAGVPLSRVCALSAAEGLTGLEFAFGIPGCVGGAVYMNAGAYGGEMRDVLKSVTLLDEAGEERTLDVSELELGYRTSVFERKPWCILSAVFSLKEGDYGAIRAQMADYARRRAEKQPLDMPSAGSAFKRPEGAYAGELIDRCGLRGCAIGGAKISEKHCGFIVNTGGATCEDVLSLADVVCGIVEKQTGYHLEKEIRVVR